MPRYYCDYCDVFLTHDSASVRKQHNIGRRHKENVRMFYQQFSEENVNLLMEQNIIRDVDFRGGMRAAPTPFAPFGIVPGMPGQLPPHLAAHRPHIPTPGNPGIFPGYPGPPPFPGSYPPPSNLPPLASLSSAPPPHNGYSQPGEGGGEGGYGALPPPPPHLQHQGYAPPPPGMGGEEGDAMNQ